MIRNKKDYKFYLEADRIALGRLPIRGISAKVKSMIIPDLIWEFEKKLRKTEYLQNIQRSPLQQIAYFWTYIQFKRLSVKLGFSIPVNVFGPGLSIAHRGTIVVNSAARIGTNCRIHVCVNIGTQAGYGHQAPIIGDNCYIGPGAKLYGPIKIGNNTAIGANCVVNKSFEETNIAIGGIPAKKLKDIEIREIIIPATEILLGQK